jgi:integrase
VRESLDDLQRNDEAGLRKQEGLQLKWNSIDRRNRILTVEHAKRKRPRYIPLSDAALQWLDSLPRIIGCPYVFVRLESQDRWRKPEKQFIQARCKAGLEWVTIHDLRHFRATQWIMRGADRGRCKNCSGTVQS